MKILVAVDGSAFTQKALAYLTANRSMFGQGSDLVLVNVSTGLPVNVTRHVTKDIVDGYYADEAAKVMDPVKKYLDAQGRGPAAPRLRPRGDRRCGQGGRRRPDRDGHARPRHVRPRTDGLGRHQGDRREPRVCAAGQVAPAARAGLRTGYELAFAPCITKASASE